VRQWLENRPMRPVQASEASAPVPPGLPVRPPAPGFSLSDTKSEDTTLETLLARGRPVALVFVSPGCGPCSQLFPDLSRWQTTLAERITIALISAGTMRETSPPV
jgi:thiol-disulfide isomerase/thioredoxin